MAYAAMVLDRHAPCVVAKNLLLFAGVYPAYNNKIIAHD